MSTFFDLANRRESCRNYIAGKHPTKEQLMNCIDAARLAPSACNSQPWSFIVVNSPEKSAAAAVCMQTNGINKFTDNCPAFIIICEEPALLMGGNYNQKYAQIDVGIATAHLCYAAAEQGLSTCIMGSFDSKMLLETLGIEEEKNIRLVLAVGFDAGDKLRPKRRKSIDEISSYIG